MKRPKAGEFKTWTLYAEAMEAYADWMEGRISGVVEEVRSVSKLQRRFVVGYSVAAKFQDDILGALELVTIRETDKIEIVQRKS